MTQFGQQSPFYMPNADERSTATMTHALMLLLGFFSPLIFLLTKGEQSKYVKDQCYEALNFAITVTIAFLAGSAVIFPLCFVLIGFALLPILFVIQIGAVVFNIIAATQTNNGVWYRYPLTWRLIK